MASATALTLIAAPIPFKDALAGGVISDIVKGVGKVTGVRPLEKLGRELDNASRDIKREVPVLRDVEEGLSRPFRETGRWIRENPEEAIAIAVVAGVGWAACVDGCTIILGIVADGATVGLGGGAAVGIPLVATTVNQQPPARRPEEREPASPPSRTEPEGRTDVDANHRSPAGTQTDATSSTPLARELPSVFPKSLYLEGLHNAPPRIVYRSLDERLGGTNEFAPPTRSAIVRGPSPTDDGAGGIFTSPRTKPAEEAVKAYGPTDARRIHGAIDFIAPPGTPVFATMTGTVVAAKEMTNKDGLQMVTIQARDGTQARLLYVQPGPDIREGAQVRAGETQIGFVMDLSRHLPYRSEPNHVHVDFTDIHGRRFDPWTNTYAVPVGQPGAGATNERPRQPQGG